MKKIITLIIVGFVFFACSSEKHNDEETHEHEHGEGTQVTFWTEKTEVFAEFGDLHLNEESHILVHLTDLNQGKPFEGAVGMTISHGASVKRYNNIEKVKKGIYEQEFTFNELGEYKFVLTLAAPINETIELGTLHLEKDEAEFHLAESGHDEHEEDHLAIGHEEPESEMKHEGEETEHDHEHHAEGEITFLKEQQWGIEFKTVEAEPMMISNSVQATAEITSKLNSDVIISAPFTGLILPDHNPSLPMIGDEVRNGQRMAVLTPSAQGDDEQNFAAHYTERESALKLSEIELDRAKRLYEKEAISLRELQKAEAEYAEAKANFGAITAFVDKYQMKDEDGKEHPDLDFVIKTPIAGTIEKIFFTPGEEIGVGKPVFRVINSNKVWVKINLPVTEVDKIRNPHRFSFTVHGMDRTFNVDQSCCKLISYGNLVEGNNRTVPIIFEVDNDARQLKLGMFADAQLYTDDDREVIAIPEEALIEDEGTYSVFVQVTGESFTKRMVTIGAKDNNYVEIKSGVHEGERVVTKGNYQVKLASQVTGIPAHGHVH